MSKIFRRNRILIVTLLAVGAAVALLTGISMAEWFPTINVDAPAARYGAASTWDPKDTKGPLLFGGFVGSDINQGVAGVSGPPFTNDGKTWAYKAGRWFNENPIHAPSARGFSAMVYDAARKNTVLFGGGRLGTNTVFGDTWTYDGEDWTLQDPPKPLPEPRQSHSMVYNRHRKLVFMYGGRGADGKPMDDAWVWDGSAWHILPNEGAPPPRYGHTMAYDACNAEVVMFGGLGNANASSLKAQPVETWTFNGDSWTPEDPPLPPTGRIGASMVYSATTGRVLLYGGLSTDPAAGVSSVAHDPDAWRWDGAGNTWEKMNSDVHTVANFWCSLYILCDLAPRQTPPARAYMMWEADPKATSGRGAQVTMYGGTPASSVAFADQYVFTEWSTFTSPQEQRISTGPGVEEAQETHGLLRECAGQVPLPAEEGEPLGGSIKPPEAAIRKGMNDTSEQIPVLTGTPWPGQSRATHTYPYGPNAKPNPNYIPEPDCPNRPGGEIGSNSYLFTDKKRNRIYQFFFCDYYRDIYNQQGQKGQRVMKLLIQVHDGTTLKPLAKVIADPVSTEDFYLGFSGNFHDNYLFHDPDRGLFYFHAVWQTSQGGGPTLDNYNEWAILSQDLMEQGKDPLVERRPFTLGSPAAVTLYTHPQSGRPKLLVSRTTTIAAIPGVNPIPGVSPTGTIVPSVSQFDFDKLPRYKGSANLPKFARDNNTQTKDKAFEYDDTTAAAQDWNGVATGCASLGVNRPMRSGNNIYIACSGSINGSNRQGVVKIPLEEKADGSEAPVPSDVQAIAGPFNISSSWTDPQAERLVLLSSYGGTQVWVFDGKVSRYVGFAGITTGPGYTRQFGFDEETGRLYAHMTDDQGSQGGGRFKDQGGILLLDTRLTPVPQVLKFPQFASPPAHPIATLRPGPGVPRRIITRQSQGYMRKYPDGERVDFNNEMFYRVLADQLPIPEQVKISDLDALTLSIPEDPGKTEALFDAEGSSYGIRLRSVGGVYSAAMPFQQGYEHGYFQLGEGFATHELVTPAWPACAFPDRELMAGWVPGARLSDLDAAARSSGLEVDSNSKVDLEGPSSRCNPTLDPSKTHPNVRPVFSVLWPLWQMVQLEANKALGTGTVEVGKDADGTPDPYPAPLDTQENPYGTPLGTLETGKDEAGNPTAKFDASTSLAWDEHFEQVECVGDSLKEYQATVGNIYGSANCVQQQGLVKATARGSATGSGPVGAEASEAGFSVGEGYSTVTVTRDPIKGVVVTSIAVAKGIELPGLAIDRVETEAVAWSNGRSAEEPRARFSRKICGVVTPDYSNSRCLSAGEQKQFVDGWNNGWKYNSKMYLPAPDPEFFTGSPRGYIVGVIKPLGDEIEDQLFAKDYQKEVPGLVVEFYKDSPYKGRQRQSLMLAATRAIAGFGVQCNTDLVYSASSGKCVELTFVEDPVEFEEEFTDDEEFSEDFDSDGEWTPVEAAATGESLGAKIGKLLDRLPVLSQIPLRQMGEALLAASVWLLLGAPLVLAGRRLTMNLER